MFTLKSEFEILSLLEFWKSFVLLAQVYRSRGSILYLNCARMMKSSIHDSLSFSAFSFLTWKKLMRMNPFNLNTLFNSTLNKCSGRTRCVCKTELFIYTIYLFFKKLDGNTTFDHFRTWCPWSTVHFIHAQPLTMLVCPRCLWGCRKTLTITSIVLEITFLDQVNFTGYISNELLQFLFGCWKLAEVRLLHKAYI